MKRTFDFTLALIGLIVASSILLPIICLVWIYDSHSPFFSARRVGKGGKSFQMIKLRSMVPNAEKTGISSTAATDRRITPIGQVIRIYKLDEFIQLWNVFKGEMSLVGPRPQIQWAVDIYTEEEKHLLTVRPGITDLASIVFADEADILKNSRNPDEKYDKVIRPWKSRLGLLYVKNKSFSLDLQIILLTLCTLFSRQTALAGVQRILNQLGADEALKRIAKREEELIPSLPPGYSLTTNPI